MYNITIDKDKCLNTYQCPTDDVKFPSDTSSSGSIAVFQKLERDKEVILPSPFPFPKILLQMLSWLSK